MDDTGLENTALSTGKGLPSASVDALFDALKADPSLAALVGRLVAVWPRLNASERRRVAAAIPDRG